MKKYSLVLVFFTFMVSSSYALGGWQFETDMPTPRSHTCSVVLGGKIYVIGGRDSQGHVVDIVEIYDPQSNSWQTGFPSLRQARENGAAAVFNGKLYVMGGRSDDGKALKKVEFFNEQKNKWEGRPNMERRRDALAAMVLGNQLYAIGGFGGPEDNSQEFLSSVEVFLPSTEKWVISSAWQLSFAQASFGAVVVGDSAYVIGGFSPFGPLNLVQVYNETAGAAQAANLLTARGGLAASLFKGNLVVAGGRSAGDLVLSSVERYDAASDVWTEAMPMTVAREQFVLEVVNDRIYAIGGRSSAGTVVATVESAANLDAVTSVEEPGLEVPDSFVLHQNYPNPFNAGTVIRVSIAESSPLPVRVAIYDLLGNLVKVLHHGVLDAGEHTYQWDGRGKNGLAVGSGIYLYAVSRGQMRAAKRMLYIK